MQCPNAILIDSKLLNKDTFWHIDRNQKLKYPDQVKNGGVRSVNFASRTAVLDPQKQNGLNPIELVKIIRNKIGQKTQNSDRFTSVYKLFDRPNRGLSKEKLKRKLRSWGVVPQDNDIDELFDKWGGTRRGVVDFNVFLGHVMGSDYTDSTDQEAQWRFEPAKKKALGRATQRQTERASGALDMHMQQKRKRRLQSQNDPEASKAHNAILEKVGQACSLGGQTEGQYLDKLLRKHRLPESGILSIQQFHDLLMMGLGLRPTAHQVQKLVQANGRGHHGKIAVFDLLRDSKTSRPGRNRYASTNRTRGTHRQKEQMQHVNQGKALFLAAQQNRYNCKSKRSGVGMGSGDAGAAAAALRLPSIGVSKSMPALANYGKADLSNSVSNTANISRQSQVNAGRLSRESEELRKIRLEKEILQLKAEILDERINHK